MAGGSVLAGGSRKLQMGSEWGVALAGDTRIQGSTVNNVERRGCTDSKNESKGIIGVVGTLYPFGLSVVMVMMVGWG